MPDTLSVQADSSLLLGSRMIHEGDRLILRICDQWIAGVAWQDRDFLVSVDSGAGQHSPLGRSHCSMGRFHRAAHSMRNWRAFPNCKKRGSGADLRVEAHFLLLKEQLRMAPLVTVSSCLLPCQSSGSLVFFLSRACSLICGSACGAMAHDAAHHVFMTLPAYTSTTEGEARQLGRGPTPYQGGPWSEEILSN